MPGFGDSLEGRSCERDVGQQLVLGDVRVSQDYSCLKEVLRLVHAAVLHQSYYELFPDRVMRVDLLLLRRRKCLEIYSFVLLILLEQIMDANSGGSVRGRQSSDL